MFMATNTNTNTDTAAMTISNTTTKSPTKLSLLIPIRLPPNTKPNNLCQRQLSLLLLLQLLVLVLMLVLLWRDGLMLLLLLLRELHMSSFGRVSRAAVDRVVRVRKVGPVGEVVVRRGGLHGRERRRDLVRRSAPLKRWCPESGMPFAILR